MIDPTFSNTNKLFVVSVRNGGKDLTRLSFSRYYMPLVEINSFNAMIDNEPFLINLWKTNKKHSGNSLDCFNHQKYYKLSGIDDGFRNMFVYQPTFDMLRGKKDKNIEYVIGWKSKYLFKSKLFQLHDVFLLFGYKIRIQFNKTP